MNDWACRCLCAQRNLCTISRHYVVDMPSEQSRRERMKMILDSQARRLGMFCFVLANFGRAWLVIVAQLW